MTSLTTIRLLIITLTLSLSATGVVAQKTVFSLLKKDQVLADELYADHKYQSALQIYSRIWNTKNSSPEQLLKIARCHYVLRAYGDAAKWYDVAFARGAVSSRDLFYYAEALAATTSIKKAIEIYRDYLDSDPDNEFVIKKIWRLDNILFLFEDSAHFMVKVLPTNSLNSDIAPVPYEGGLVFASNRKTLQVIEHVDASTHTDFFKLYFARQNADSLAVDGNDSYAPAELWRLNSDKRLHYGPVSFYAGGQKMVFTRTGDQSDEKGERNLQLYFAEYQHGEWRVTGTFPYNSATSSISDPSISPDGSVLYFSSNMPGGRGGKDLYKSQFFDGAWSKPINLFHLNTPYDEVSPFIAMNEFLYFASNGHAGLGGLDIFRAAVTNSGFGEIENPGYPLNTHLDDFALVIDSLATHGYLSSNRINGGQDDDLFEFDIDLHRYPLIIAGVVRHKESNWSDSSQLRIMPHAKLTLIDNMRNIPVFECFSDQDGNFRLEVPYFSSYKIRVTGQDSHENIVSLEISKHRKEGDSQYDIVVVKDPFKLRTNDEPR